MKTAIWCWPDGVTYSCFYWDVNKNKGERTYVDSRQACFLYPTLSIKEAVRQVANDRFKRMPL